MYIDVFLDQIEWYFLCKCVSVGLNRSRIVSKRLNFFSMSFFFRLEKSHFVDRSRNTSIDFMGLYFFRYLSTYIYLILVDFHWASFMRLQPENSFHIISLSDQKMPRRAPNLCRVRKVLLMNNFCFISRHLTSEINEITQSWWTVWESLRDGGRSLLTQIRFMTPPYNLPDLLAARQWLFVCFLCPFIL
jgi:hypothetical protein